MRVLIIVVSVLVFVWLAFVRNASADEEVPYSDLHGREAPVEDLIPHPLLPLAEPAARPSVSFALTWIQRPTRHDVGGGVVLSFPTETVARRSMGAPSSLRARKAKTATQEEEPPPPREPEVKVRAKMVLPRIRPAVARAAISAALRHHAAADERLDDLASRARWSAILPEVRLRATRLIDESQSFSPTSYDPDRTTSTGGVSLWLEGRTTWYFDRLVFADEEVSIERMRQELGRERERITKRVLELLFGWQRAAQRARDPLIDPQRCVEALLEEEQRALELDVLTGGWFARWLRDHPLVGLDCSERPPPEESSYADDHGDHPGG